MQLAKRSTDSPTTHLPQADVQQLPLEQCSRRLLLALDGQAQVSHRVSQRVLVERLLCW